MYQPKDCNTLETTVRQQIRQLIQGPYGTGKTFSALTAPNPCVINFDNNLGAHAGRKDVIDVPFYDSRFVTKYNSQGYRHLAVGGWIQKEGTQLTSEQTLVIDGLTNLHNHYDREVAIPMSSRTGREDLMAWWGMKLEWNKEFFENLKSLKCDVIVCCHEQTERDDEGKATGKILPLVQGSFKDQIGTHFTDIFRQHAITKPSSDAELAKFKLIEYGFKDVKDLQKFAESFETSTMYLWQTSPDSIVNCKKHLINLPKFVKADYMIFNSR